ncbi:MAG: hypothetical protein IPI64_14855 [Chloracidobacterium sp.]|nr:hypothetical protein [Chloracidobacterium sp.]
MAVGKTYWAMFVLMLLSSGSLAQRSPLVVSGAITGVKVEGPLVFTPFDINDPKYPYERKDPYFDVTVKLQYCNHGEVALIVPMSSSFPNEKKKILFLELPSTDSKVSEAVSGFVYSGGRDPMPGFIDELGKPEPSRYRFAIIEAGQCYESGDRISIKSGYKLEVQPNVDKRRAPIELAIPEHSYFKLQYVLSMKDSLPVSEAKQRWSKFGKLLTNADGDFVLETEFIINK